MKRRISIILISSGTILLILSMLLSTVSFAATGLAPRGIPLQEQICTDGAAYCVGKPVGTIKWIGGGKCKECQFNSEGPDWVKCDLGDPPGGCPLPPCPAGEPCDDGNACTENDICQDDDTTCAGTAITCNDDNVCTDDSCNPASGCVFTNNTDPCNDGDACTENDTCAGGVCAGTAKDCSGLDEECKVGVCNETSGVCEAQNKADGTSCNDLDPCTDPDVCTAGVCGGPWICGECETNADCDDGDVCTDDICEADYTCSHTNNTASCDDLDPCTENDVCAAGVCAGTAKDCSGLDAQCKVGVCNETTGVCEAQNKDDGTSCDDLDPCTDPDVCTAGVCGGPWICACKTDLDCDDGNICTDDVCGADYTCSYTNNTDPCDDGKFCTENDVCAGGVCAGTAISCDDGDICTDDSCDEAADTCVNVFDVTNDASCAAPTPTPTPGPCANATIYVDVTQCNAPVAGLSVVLHSSAGDSYGPKMTPATFSVMGGTNRDWYAVIDGARMGGTIKVTACGGTGAIGVVLDCVPTPTVVEVLGVERLPVTGEMPLAPVLPSLHMILSSLTLIGSGLLLRRKD